MDRESRTDVRGTATVRGAATRAAIVRAAAEVVVEQGWRAATARVVAARAGVPLGSVSYHFPDKQVLVREAVLAELAEVFAAPIAALAGARSAEELVASQARWMLAADLPPARRRFLLELLVEGTRDAHLGVVVAEALAGWRFGLAAALRRVTPATVDPDSGAAALAAALSGVLVLTVADPAFPVDAALAAVVERSR